MSPFLRSVLWLSLAASIQFAPARVWAQPSASAVGCADSLRRVLGSLEGVWDVEAGFRQGPAAWDSAAAVVTITPDLGGCVLREHFVGTRWGTPYEYLSTWGVFGAAEAPVQQAFVHSQHGILSVNAGRFQGDTLVLQARHTVRGASVLEERRYAGIAPPAFSVVNRRTTDDGATWTVTSRARFQYRGRAP